MFRLLLTCFVICATMLLSMRADAVEKAAAVDKPNIVLIMADDVSWEAFSCYGAEDYKTPHIDALAARGSSFCPLLLNTHLHTESCADHDWAVFFS